MLGDDDAGVLRVGERLLAVGDHGVAERLVGVLQVAYDDDGNRGQQGRADGFVECVPVGDCGVKFDEFGIRSGVLLLLSQVADRLIVEIGVTAGDDAERCVG